jgi:hypothetical protein
MSNSRYPLLQLVLGPALLLTLMPSGCAVGVEPEFEDEPLSSAGGGLGGGGNGGSAGKTNATGGSSAGTPSTPSTAGTTSVSGSGSNPFGGSSSGGKGGSGSGGTNGGAGAAGSAGSSSAGAGGSGGTSGGCSCAKTLAWMDDMVMNWATGDCVTTAGVTYRYVGMKAQTYANGDCNPAKQEPWCSDSGNDYKFMACP